MPHIEAIGHQLAEKLKKYSADYIEVHLEESQASHISYRGRELESIGRSTAIGGNVRALVRGGWGFTSFNNLDGLGDKIELAIKQAKAAGNEESKLAEVAPVVDIVPAGIETNPVTIPLAQKSGYWMNIMRLSGRCQGVCRLIMIILLSIGTTSSSRPCR